MNWLEIPADGDPFGAALLAKGLSLDRIKAWGLDPQVTLEDGSSVAFTKVRMCPSPISPRGSLHIGAPIFGVTI